MFSSIEIMNGGYVPRHVSASFYPLSNFLDTKYFKVSKGKKMGLSIIQFSISLEIRPLSTLSQVQLPHKVSPLAYFCFEKFGFALLSPHCPPLLLCETTNIFQ